MTDQELKRIIGHIDAALLIVRRNRGIDPDPLDGEIAAMLVDLRKDLAVYRAISQAAAKSKAT